MTERELIEAKDYMMPACPINPLFYKYDRGDMLMRPDTAMTAAGVCKAVQQTYS